MIELTDQPIDSAAVTERVRSAQAGAVVLFLGTVREFTQGVQTASLQYDAYPEMACKAMQQLEEEARQQWPLTDVCLVHRTGHLQLGETAVAVAVSSGHRTEAFEAAKWLIDTLKQRVPIWKKENYADGTTEWVHPDQTSEQSSSPETSSP